MPQRGRVLLNDISLPDISHHGTTQLVPRRNAPETVLASIDYAPTHADRDPVPGNRRRHRMRIAIAAAYAKEAIRLAIPVNRAQRPTRLRFRLSVGCGFIDQNCHRSGYYVPTHSRVWAFEEFRLRVMRNLSVMKGPWIWPAGQDGKTEIRRKKLRGAKKVISSSRATLFASPPCSPDLRLCDFFFLPGGWAGRMGQVLRDSTRQPDQWKLENSSDA